MHNFLFKIALTNEPAVQAVGATFDDNITWAFLFPLFAEKRPYKRRGVTGGRTSAPMTIANSAPRRKEKTQAPLFQKLPCARRSSLSRLGQI